MIEQKWYIAGKCLLGGGGGCSPKHFGEKKKQKLVNLEGVFLWGGGGAGSTTILVETDNVDNYYVQNMNITYCNIFSVKMWEDPKCQKRIIFAVN